MKSHEELEWENMIYEKLKEAAIEAESTDIRYSHEEVFNELREKLIKKLENKEHCGGTK